MCLPGLQTCINLYNLVKGHVQNSILPYYSCCNSCSIQYTVYTTQGMHALCIEYLGDLLGLAKTNVQYENTDTVEEYCLPQCNTKDLTFLFPVLRMITDNCQYSKHNV